MTRYLITAQADDESKVVVDLTPEQAEGVAMVAAKLNAIGGYTASLEIVPADQVNPEDLPYPHGEVPHGSA